MPLSTTERRTLTNVSSLVRSLGDTPLAQHFDALVARLAPSVAAGDTIAPYAGSDLSRLPSFVVAQYFGVDTSCGCPLGSEHVCGEDWTGALTR